MFFLLLGIMLGPLCTSSCMLVVVLNLCLTQWDTDLIVLYLCANTIRYFYSSFTITIRREMQILVALTASDKSIKCFCMELCYLYVFYIFQTLSPLALF